MKISTKGRYAIVCLSAMAETLQEGECLSLIALSEKFNISKIYLEQVFSLLKRAHIVTSIKGAQGGYQLSKDAQLITVLDILKATDSSLFEKTEQTIHTDDLLESVIQDKVYSSIDTNFTHTLEQITLKDIVLDLEDKRQESNYMYYL